MNDVNQQEAANPVSPAAGKAKKKKIKKKTIMKIVGAIAIISPLITFSSDLIKLVKEALNLGETIIKTDCDLKVDPLDFPSSVEYSAWDEMTLHLQGKYNCSKSFGLYVTFIPRGNDSRWRLEPPGASTDMCKAVSGSLLHPQCWEPRKPIAVKSEGQWEWEFAPPILRKIGPFGDSEKIKLLYEVRDYDAPDKMLQTNTVTITVKKDT